MVFYDRFSLDAGMTGNDGEAVVPSVNGAVLLKRQFHAAPTEPICALAEKGHPLSVADMILHKFNKALIRPAEKGLVLGQSFLTHACLSFSHARSP
jgi:hypothetical protein